VLKKSEIAAAFTTLGIAIKDVIALAPEDLWSRMGAALLNTTDAQAAYNAVGDIFGAKIGPRMVAMLKDTAAGMSAVTAEAMRAGQVLDADLVEKAHTFDRALELTGKAIKIGWVQLISDIGSLFKTDDFDFVGQMRKRLDADIKLSEDARANRDKGRAAEAAADDAALAEKDKKQHEILAQQDKADEKATARETERRLHAYEDFKEREKDLIETFEAEQDEFVRRDKDERDFTARINAVQPGRLSVSGDSAARIGAQSGGDNRGGEVERRQMLDEVRQIRRQMEEERDMSET